MSQKKGCEGRRAEFETDGWRWSHEAPGGGNPGGGISRQAVVSWGGWQGQQVGGGVVFIALNG